MPNSIARNLRIVVRRVFSEENGSFLWKCKQRWLGWKEHGQRLTDTKRNQWKRSSTCTRMIFTCSKHTQYQNHYHSPEMRLYSLQSTMKHFNLAKIIVFSIEVILLHLCTGKWDKHILTLSKAYLFSYTYVSITYL